MRKCNREQIKERKPQRANQTERTRMFFLSLIIRNALRHRLRTALTVLGMVVAVLAFGLLATVVDAWYAGADAASDKRLVTRNATSLVFPLPLTYYPRIRAIDGVQAVSWANWFGGVYKEPKNFFPQFAIEARGYLALYPEFLLSDAEREGFLRDRRGAIVGRKTAELYGLRVGDNITLRGTIYPGNWDFVIRGIYHGARKNTDETQFFFHWDYLNETIKIRIPGRENRIGVYIAEVSDASEIARIARDIDAQFKNASAETLSETEKAFQLGFVAMTEAIVVAIRLVSYLVIFIIMAVMANTMAMTARERTSEYATLRALGFGPAFLHGLIYGESLAIALCGGLLGVVLTFPVAAWVGHILGKFLPVFTVSIETVQMQFIAALLVGFLAAIWPARTAARVNIVNGLRAVA